MAYLDKTGLTYFWGKIKEKINAKASMLDCYPVGAIYMSTNSTSPASLFGGTWEQLKDRFLLAAGDTYKAGSTGGESTHTLIVKEIPSHYHIQMAVDSIMVTSYDIGTEQQTGGRNIDNGSEYTRGFVRRTFNEGGGLPHNNMPPYLTVYVWKRIA